MKPINLKIISSGKYVPKGTITNEDLEKIVDTSDEWIVSRTGIKKRHKAAGEIVTELAYKAALDAIEAVSYDTSKIDLIIVATITNKLRTPSVGNEIQRMLGLKHDVMSFDVTAACTGFIYAMDVAASLFLTGRYRGALIIGAETLTDIVDYTDRNTCILFGDGAGAVIVEPTAENKPSYYYSAATPDDNGYLTVDDTIRMDGKRVYQFAVDAMEKGITRMLEVSGLTMADIDRIIPHQANQRIIQAVAKNMNIAMDKFVMNIAEYGNTSAASIPISLNEYLLKEGQSGQKLIFVGFGGGFTWGSALMTL